MSLSDLAALGGFVSSFAVLVSLVLLYFQLRQVAAQVKLAEKSSRAVVAQERTNRNSDIQMQLARDIGLSEAVDQGMAGAPDMTPGQVSQFRRYIFAVFLNAEDSFLQHENGLLSDDAFATFERRFSRGFRSLGIRVLWKAARSTYNPEFVAFCDRIMAQTKVGELRDSLANWNADLAAEKTLAERQSAGTQP